jgi:hypothetical protein
LKLINVDAGMFELYGGHRVYLEITADETHSSSTARRAGGGAGRCCEGLAFQGRGFHGTFVTGDRSWPVARVIHQPITVDTRW